MKISSAFILSEKTSSAPIPIPIEPVQASFTGSNITYPYRMYNKNVDKYANLTNTRQSIIQNVDSSGEYYKSIGYDTIPCNWGGGGSIGETTLYPNQELSSYYTDLWIYSPKGSYTLNIGNTLIPGKYCFQMTFWLGFYDALTKDKTAYEGHVSVNGNRKEIIKQGTNGVIYAKTIDSEGVLYDGAKTNPYQAPYYRGNCVCFQVQYAFDIVEEDTTKTFSFGDNTEFSFLDLYDSIKMWETTGTYESRGSVWANCTFLLNLKLYTTR